MSEQKCWNCEEHLAIPASYYEGDPGKPLCRVCDTLRYYIARRRNTELLQLREENARLRAYNAHLMEQLEGKS